MSNKHKNWYFEPDKPWLCCRFKDKDHQIIMSPHELEADMNDPPAFQNDEIYERVLGSMMGMAIGDALGAHVEFRPRTYLEAHKVKDLEGGGTWGLRKGQFTDDTSMGLCLATSLIARRGFVPYDQMVRYKWWYRFGYMSSTGKCFDIGAATRESLIQFEKNQSDFSKKTSVPLEYMDFLSDKETLKKINVYCSHDGVAGNGALMRLAPVPLFSYRNPPKAVEYAGISGRITHGDQKAYDACRYYAALIVGSLRGESKKELLSSEFVSDHESWFADKNLHPDIQKIANGSFKKKKGYEDGIRGTGYIVNSLEAALWAFWSDENSFEKGVLNAVNLGDDTDTTAAIYGQLAGAHYGFNELPARWVKEIYARKFIDCISKWLVYEGEEWSKSHPYRDIFEEEKHLIQSPSAATRLRRFTTHLPMSPISVSNEDHQSQAGASNELSVPIHRRGSRDINNDRFTSQKSHSYGPDPRSPGQGARRPSYHYVTDEDPGET